MRATSPTIILVVDDNEVLRRSISRVLRLSGYQVDEALDGAEALAMLRRGLRPHLILLDLQMPGMDGETFCDCWRADPQLSRIPVVLCTATPNAAPVAERLRASGVLQKPITAPQLLETVQRHTQ
jgi:two-component system chemotaxis response regulator CheY